MAIRQGLLALLDEGPAYGYQLKAAFEERTGGTWPLNIGQVYTTLARAERDGLVAQLETDDDGRVVYEITAAGRTEVAQWFQEPVRRETAPRDELAIKLAVAVTAPDVDVTAIVQTQRGETMRTLQQLTRLKRDADEDADLAWLLVLDRLIFDAEAEARWLDHCESRLARKAGEKAVRRPASGRSPRAAQGSAR
ncbi:MAG: PadR family transcriptional regulator [Actinobacteria bacterium]|jgi:DNA-binding PadR family transcriptional regulator|nr:PadR family transcriptional regulator [Actinomycetota bacterium]